MTDIADLFEKAANLGEEFFHMDLRAHMSRAKDASSLIYTATITLQMTPSSGRVQTLDVSSLERDTAEEAVEEAIKWSKDRLAAG